MKNPYIFKVGDKGETRDGTPYEVLLVDERLTPPLYARVGRSITLSGRWADGTNVSGSESPRDLIPAPRTVYVNFYADGSCAYFDYEDDAVRADAFGLADTALAIAVPVILPR